MFEKISTDAFLEQFLVWLVKGCVLWHSSGLSELSISMKNILSEYKLEIDYVKTFIDNYCEIDKKNHISASDFRNELTKKMNIKIFVRRFNNKNE